MLISRVTLLFGVSNLVNSVFCHYNVYALYCIFFEREIDTISFFEEVTSI